MAAAGSVAAAAVAPTVFHAMQTAGTPSGAGSAKLQEMSIADKIRNRSPSPSSEDLRIKKRGSA